jgi:lipopolysaccharide/colanic/teichoic acid biosynthesis glycosyltransferase
MEVRRVLARVRPYTNGIVVLFKLALYAMLFFAFFLFLSVPNPQLLRVSRTSAVTMSTFAVLVFLFSSVYGQYDIGKRTSKSIVYSMAIATLLTDLVTYFQLQIMNVNDANNAYLKLWGFDFALLFAACCVQVLMIVLMAYAGNHVFFKINPPENCLIISSSQSFTDKIVQKLSQYKLQYNVVRTADYRDPKLYVYLQACDAVFLYEIPIAVRREIVEFCYQNHINVHYQMDVLDVIEASMDEMFLDDVVLLSYTKPLLSMEQRFVKRTMDIAVSLILLVVTSPLMLLSALAILCLDGRPILYQQYRLSRGGRRFLIHKFRTMKLSEDILKQHYSVLEGDARITRSGRFLRRSRLDELPQLLNVLKGEMSMVGPRPEMLENISAYTQQYPAFDYRLKVKAGLTGYAQIAGKYNTPPKDKLILDLMYIENYSILTDLRLLIKTPIVFFKPDSTEGFKGDEPSEADGFEAREKTIDV